MSQKSRRAKLILTVEQQAQLTDLAQSRTAGVREVERAKILLHYAEGHSVSAIQKILRISRQQFISASIRR